eukprot:Clim_evm5s61 gene=Clim_evmTU5s61
MESPQLAFPDSPYPDDTTFTPEAPATRQSYLDHFDEHDGDKENLDEREHAAKRVKFDGSKTHHKPVSTGCDDLIRNITKYHENDGTYAGLTDEFMRKLRLSYGLDKRFYDYAVHANDRCGSTKVVANLLLGGLRIKFPFKPYKVQLQMMTAMVKAMAKKENALLEAPTGSGKSMAIICAASAYLIEQEKTLAKEVQKLQDEEDQDRKNVKDQNEWLRSHFGGRDNEGFCLVREDGKLERLNGDGQCKQCWKVVKTSDNAAIKKMKVMNEGVSQSRRPGSLQMWASQDVNDFVSDQGPSQQDEKHILSISSVPDEDVWCDCDIPQFAFEGRRAHKLKPTKIYVASRTHRQLSQLIKEFKRTPYGRQISSVVLGARTHTCINDDLMNDDRFKDKNEGCKEFRKLRKCKKHQEIEELSSKLNTAMRDGLVPVADIEDLRAVGKKHDKCPYYISDYLHKHASSIVFCPYNYIIDPNIRDAKEIDLDNAIIIIDEGHNIEDVARDSLSCKFSVQQIANFMSQLATHVKALEAQSADPYDDFTEGLATSLRDMVEAGAVSPDLIRAVRDLLQFYTGLNRWAQNCIEFPERETMYESNSTTKRGMHFLTELKQYLTSDQLKDASKACQFLNDLDTDLVFSKEALDRAGSLVRVFNAMEEDNKACANDFCVYGVKNPANVRQNREEVITIHILLLNPAVVMRDIGTRAHSVIITSGTLSPMNTFAAELGLNFPHVLEGDHVNPVQNTFVAPIGVGLDGRQINTMYKQINDVGMQDRMAKSILEILNATPGGVLIFFTSYRTMKNLLMRWANTGELARMAVIKKIFAEPKDNDQLDVVMQKYRSVVTDAQNPVPGNRITGACLFAVFRGKVSEGIDFADDLARAVVVAGIPYPNTQDKGIEEKKRYNNERHRMGLTSLNGDDWMSTQAYRALNQALGRCIRHREDWGSILMMDARFYQQPVIGKVSKWIRGRVRPCGNRRVQEMALEIKDFCKRCTAADHAAAERRTRVLEDRDSDEDVSGEHRDRRRSCNISYEEDESETTGSNAFRSVHHTSGNRPFVNQRRPPNGDNSSSRFRINTRAGRSRRQYISQFSDGVRVEIIVEDLLSNGWLNVIGLQNAMP